MVCFFTNECNMLGRPELKVLFSCLLFCERTEIKWINQQLNNYQININSSVVIGTLSRARWQQASKLTTAVHNVTCLELWQEFDLWLGELCFPLISPKRLTGRSKKFPTYLPTCPPTYLPTYLPTSIPTYIKSVLLLLFYLSAHLSTYYLPAYLPPYLPTYLPPYLPT